MEDPPNTPRAHANVSVYIPLSRARALVRGLYYSCGVGLCGAAMRFVIPALHFSTSGASNRIEDYALAFLLMPIAALGLWLAWRALKWLALAAWPGRLGFEADAGHLTLSLGPLGTQHLDAARIRTTYLFEMNDSDIGEDRFEAFLPEKVQMSTMLPRMQHPECDRPIRDLMLAYTGTDEASLASRLLPIVKLWRSRR